MHNSKYKKSFTYLGGKFSVLPFVLPVLDIEHNHFVEVFGGSAVVTINRPPSPIETYNDLNNSVVNFFAVLRQKPLDLIDALQLTPHSRKEYQDAWYNENDSDVEKARKFFIRCVQSQYAAGAQQKSKGWAAAHYVDLISMSLIL